MSAVTRFAKSKITVIQEQARKELERQTEEYHRALSKAECREDKDWSKIAARSARRLWDK